MPLTTLFFMVKTRRDVPQPHVFSHVLVAAVMPARTLRPSGAKRAAHNAPNAPTDEHQAGHDPLDATGSSRSNEPHGE